MGMIQSIFCSITFCVERVLTWTCCAFLLMLLMFMLVLLMTYGITVGYHYAQKELASFAMTSRETTPEPTIGGNKRRSAGDLQPVVRLVAVNQSETNAQPPVIEVYTRRAPDERILLDPSPTPIILLETERPPRQPALSPHERELAKKLIGRFRRSRNYTVPGLYPVSKQSVSTEIPFLRPLRNYTVT